MKKSLLFILLLGASFNIFSQAPIITGISRIPMFPAGKVSITGSGFAVSDPSRLYVWFGSAKGQIIYNSDNLIDVMVPYGASEDNITIVNTEKNTSVSSSFKFYPSYMGTNFGNKFVRDYSTSTEAETGKGFIELCACDFDLNNKVDIAVSRSNSKATFDYYLNTTAPANYSGLTTFKRFGSSHQSYGADIDCADLDNDGFPDIVVTQGNGGGQVRTNVFIFENSFGGFTNVLPLPLSPLPPIAGGNNNVTQDAILKDLNGDGLKEIVFTNLAVPEIVILKNISSGGKLAFEDKYYRIPIPNVEKTNVIEIQDMNNDGKAEIIFDDLTNLYIVPNNSSSTGFDFDINQIQTIPTKPSILEVITGYYDGDKVLDLVFTTFNDGVFIFKSSTKQVTPVISFADVVGLNKADINGDGLLDIVATITTRTNVFFAINNGVTFDLLPIEIANMPVKVLANDFNVDGRPDLATIVNDGGGEKQLEVYRNQNCYKPLILSLPTRSICAGQEIPITANKIPNATYTWMMNDQPIDGYTDNTFIVKQAGKLTVKVTTMLNAGNCDAYSISDPIIFEAGDGSIDVAAEPSYNGPVCEGSVIQMVAKAPLNSILDPLTTFHWYGPNDYYAEGETAEIMDARPIHAGEYRLVSQLENCESGETFFYVEVISFPENVPIIATTSDGSASTGGFCEGKGDVTLQLDLPAGHPYTLIWNRDGTQVGSGESIVTNVGGTFSVLASFTSPDGISCNNIIAEQIITSIPPPQGSHEPSATTACKNQLVSLTAGISNPVDGFTPLYIWNLGDGRIIETTDETIDVSWPVAGSYEYTLTTDWVELRSCLDSFFSITSPISITEADKPVISGNGTEICFGKTVELSVDPSFDPVTWYKEGVEAPVGEGSVFVATEHGNYYVVTISNNCEIPSDIYTINPIPAPEVIIAGPAGEMIGSDTLVDVGATIDLAAKGTASLYYWGPPTLVADTLANPISVSVTEPRYLYLYGEDDQGCIGKDTLLISTGDGPLKLLITPKRVITPSDSPDQGDFWQITDIENYEHVNLEYLIMDRRGVIVKKLDTGYGLSQDWNGVSDQGKELPQGTYYYIIRDLDGKYLPYKGTLLIIR